MISGLNSNGAIGIAPINNNNNSNTNGHRHPQQQQPQQQHQFYDDEPYHANGSHMRFKSMERRETGNLIPIAQRITSSTPFGSAPVQGYFGSGMMSSMATSPRKMPPQMLFGSGGPIMNQRA